MLIANDVDIFVSIDNQDNSNIEPEIVLKEGLQAPIAKGDIVGTISYEVEGLRYTTDLIAGSDVEEFKQSYILLYVLVAIVILIIIILFIRYYNKKKKFINRRNKYISNS